MNNNEGKIWYGIGLETKEIQKDAQRANNALKGIGDKAVAEGSRIDNTMRNIGGAIAAAFTIQQAGLFIKQVATIRGEFQQLEIAFTTMLRSKEKADQLMKEIVTFAATTPFDLKGVAGGAKQLLAYGFEADSMTENLTMLGNIAAGVGSQIGDIIYLYGTLNAQGKVMTKDLMQFAGRGIPIYKELAEVFKTNEKGVLEMASAGKIAFEDVEKAFQNMVSEQGMFYNLMQEQSKSITGQMSNLGDSIDSMFNEIGQSSEDVISSVIQGAGYLVENYKAVGAIVGSLIAVYGTYKAALIAVAAMQTLNITLSKGWTVAELAKLKVLILVEGAQKLLNKTMLLNPYVAVAAALATVVAGLVIYSKTLGKVVTQEEMLADIQREAEKSVRGEVKELDRLKKVLNDSSKSYDERKAALERIKEIVPEYHASLTDEGTLINNNSDALDAYVEKLIIAEKLKIAVSKQSQASDKYEAYKQKVMDTDPKMIGQVLNLAASGKANQMTAAQRTVYETLQKLAKEAVSFEKVIENLQTELANVKTKKPTKTTTTVVDEDALTLAQQIAKEEKEMLRQSEDFKLKKEEAEISLWKDGSEKELALIELAYRRKILEIDRQEEDLLFAAQVHAEKKAKLKKGQKFDPSTVTLTTEQTAVFTALREGEKGLYESEKSKAFDSLLKKYQDYAAERLSIEKKFNDDLAILEAGKNKEGADVEKIDASINALKKQQQVELNNLDLEIANRSETFKAWANKITKLGLEQLVNSLEAAKDALSLSDGTDEEKAVLRARIETLQNQIKVLQAGDPLNNKKLKDTLKVMNEINESIENTISGFEGMGESTKTILTAAANISGAVIASITGIVALSVTGAEAIKGVERASVILAIIGAAISVVTIIINLFTTAAKKRKAEEEASLERQRQEYFGLLDYNNELEQRYEWVKKIGEAELDFIRRKGEELKKQRESNDSEQAELLAKVQQFKYLSGYETKSKFGTTHFNPKAGDPGTYQKEVWSSLAGKTYEEISELAAQGKLSEEAQKYYEYLKKAKEEGEDIERMQLEFIQSLKELATGTTAQSITDSIVEGFKAGKRTAADFADTFEKLMQGAVQSALKQLTDKKVLAWYDKFYELSKDGLTDKEKAELQADWNNLISDVAKDALNIESITGTSITDEETRSASSKGFASMSQDSANELNGRFTALQGITSNIADGVRDLAVNSMRALNHLAGIEVNTASTTKKLDSIQTTMNSVKSGIDDINTKGIFIKG